jgi:hypothetical protein
MPANSMKPSSARTGLSEEIVSKAVARLLGVHGPASEARIRTGVRQVAERWWEEDGGAAAFASFCQESFTTSAEDLEAIFARLGTILEQVQGHLHEIRRGLNLALEVDTGPIRAIDRLLGDVDLAAHLDDDLYRSKVAFLALLNFPIHRLEDRLAAAGPGWTRRDWALSRLMDRFAVRVPAAVLQNWTRVTNDAEQYIAGYNLRLDRLVDAEGERPFPEELRLISHWGLRDELASQYADPEQGLARQRLIRQVMERIIRQEIPKAVIDNGDLLWDPASNRVWPLEAGESAGEADLAALQQSEPDTRYAKWLQIFHAARELDPYSPLEPTFVQRRFDRDRQIPESEVEALLVSVLEAPEVHEVARLIERRLGRPLEAFDLWYPGFKSRGSHGEEELDRLVRSRYPDLAAFQQGLPQLLQEMGFRPETSSWLAERIAVDPARGAGHALAAQRREDKAHLRTRVPQGGMDYKGYNVAMHELGHNVEQVFSLNGIDDWFLAGVPNTAFTEAIAFVFQHRDLELLGLGQEGDQALRDEALATLWNTYEISGVSLVDLWVWHWLYDHPDATPEDLKIATLAIAREVWNRYFAPVFGVRDSELLAIYSHMIAYGLYLPDYAIGHVIAFQVVCQLQKGDFGSEIERLTRQGNLTPDAWMRGAVGGPISARALLDAARLAAMAALAEMAAAS